MAHFLICLRSKHIVHVPWWSGLQWTAVRRWWRSGWETLSADRNRKVQQTASTADCRRPSAAPSYRRRGRDSPGDRPVQRPAPLTACWALRPGRGLSGGAGVGHVADGVHHTSSAVVPAWPMFDRRRCDGVDEDCWPVWKGLTTENDSSAPVHDDDRSSPQTRRRNSSPTSFRCCREWSLTETTKTNNSDDYQWVNCEFHFYGIAAIHYCINVAVLVRLKTTSRTEFIN